MSKIYLQEKITPVAGKYLVIGQDGNVTTGDLPTGTFPTLNVIVPSGSTNVTVTQGVVSLPLTQIDSTTWRCNPSAFGIWQATCLSQGSTLTETINIAEIKSYSLDLGVAVRSILNDNSWEVIQNVARQSLGSSYWAVGDKKEIILNGNIGYGMTKYTQFDNYSTYVFIIDFDHNISIEGIGITFQGFMKADGTKIAIHLDRGSSTSDYPDGSNSVSNNKGTWLTRNYRNRYLGQDKANPSAYSLMSCLSEDLRAVLKPVTKYSWNDLLDTNSTGISATTDYLFLPSMYEIFSTVPSPSSSEDYSYSKNTAEQNYCTIYSYYSDVTSNLTKSYLYDSSTNNLVSFFSRTALRLRDLSSSSYPYYYYPMVQTWRINTYGSPYIEYGYSYSISGSNWNISNLITMFVVG